MAVFTFQPRFQGLIFPAQRYLRQLVFSFFPVWQLPRYRISRIDQIKTEFSALFVSSSRCTSCVTVL